MPRTSTRPSAVAVRWAFAVALLILPVELAIQWLWSEPYPAITQPAFAFSARPLEVEDALPKSEAWVTVLFDDGSVRDYSAEELVGWTAGVSPSTILRDTIVDRGDASPQVAQWIADRVAATGERRHPVSAVIRIDQFRVDAHTLTELQRSTRSELTVDLSAVQR
ncbi:hypothetical protein [Schumannella luteola]